MDRVQLADTSPRKGMPDMSDTDTTYSMTPRTARPSALGDLRFAGTIAAGLVAGTLGLGALAAPLVGWKDWPSALTQRRPASRRRPRQGAATKARSEQTPRTARPRARRRAPRSTTSASPRSGGRQRPARRHRRPRPLVGIGVARGRLHAARRAATSPAGTPSAADATGAGRRRRRTFTPRASASRPDTPTATATTMPDVYETTNGLGRRTTPADSDRRDGSGLSSADRVQDPLGGR